jgi:hypothetical protein
LTFVYGTSVISSIVSRASAGVLAVAGAVLLFGSDIVLPRVVPGFPAGDAWFGQLVGAAWLAVAASNWLQRRSVLGGIYGRPVVFANLVLYFVSALSLLRALLAGVAPPLLWAAFLVAGVMAAAYGTLLVRGPLRPADGVARHDAIR